MSDKPLTLTELGKVARFLQTLSDDDLNRKGFLLVMKKFPQYARHISEATDIAGLVKYERLRRKSGHS